MDFILDTPPISVNRRNYTTDAPFRNPNTKTHEAVQKLLQCKSREDWPIPIDDDKFFFIRTSLPRLGGADPHCRLHRVPADPRAHRCPATRGGVGNMRLRVSGAGQGPRTPLCPGGVFTDFGRVEPPSWKGQSGMLPSSLPSHFSWGTGAGLVLGGSGQRARAQSRGVSLKAAGGEEEGREGAGLLPEKVIVRGIAPCQQK